MGFESQQVYLRQRTHFSESFLPPPKVQERELASFDNNRRAAGMPKCDGMRIFAIDFGNVS